MSKLVIANFKMNGSKEFIESWAQDFLEEGKSNKTIIVALPSLIYQILKIVISIWSQNVSNQSSGAFIATLCINVKRCGAEYCLIGHSEARQYCGN